MALKTAKKDKLLTIKEVLGISKVSRYTLYRDIKSGYVPAVYLGRNVRIRESDAIKYANAKGQSTLVQYYRNKENDDGN